MPQTVYVPTNKMIYLTTFTRYESEIAIFDIAYPTPGRKVCSHTGTDTSVYSQIKLANEGWMLNYSGELVSLATDTQFTITYLDQGGGEFSGVHDPGYPTKFWSGATSDVDLDTPSKQHYTFGGWYTSTNGGVTLGTKKTNTYGLSADITLYAKWTEKTSYNISYYDAGGSAYSGTNAEVLPVKKYNGENETLPDGLKPGFVFGGWYTNSACTGKPVTVLTGNSSTSLYAKWTRESYIITWVSSVASYNGASSMPSLREPGTTLTVPEVSKTYYVFQGWYFNPEFTGAKVTRLTDENAPGDVTLYAKWKPHYTITYKDFGGGDYSGVHPAYGFRTYWNSGEPYTLQRVTKDGFIFMGWYTESDELIAILDDTTCTSDMTLYAKWKEGSRLVNISFDSGDVAITQAEENGVVTLTAADGFTGYSWTVFGKTPSGFAGFAVSADGKTLTVTKADLLEGLGYEVKVLAFKNEMPYQTFITVTK